MRTNRVFTSSLPARIEEPAQSPWIVAAVGVNRPEIGDTLLAAFRIILNAVCSQPGPCEEHARRDLSK